MLDINEYEIKKTNGTIELCVCLEKPSPHSSGWVAKRVNSEQARDFLKDLNHSPGEKLPSSAEVRNDVGINEQKRYKGVFIFEDLASKKKVAVKKLESSTPAIKPQTYSKKTAKTKEG